MHSLQSFATLAAFTLCATAPLHADITVGPLGSGAETSNLNAALFNAVSGETVFVFPGEYEEIRIVRKDIRIIGAGADLVRIRDTDSLVVGQASRIDDLLASQTVFVSGVTFDMIANTALIGPLVLTNNAGRIHFHDCAFESTVPVPVGPISVFSSADVIFDQCTLLGSMPVDKGKPTVSSVGGNGCSLDGSTVTFNDCFIEAGTAPVPGLFFSNGGIGIDAINCSLRLHNTTVIGGGAINSSSLGEGSGAGIELQSSDLQVSGAPGTQVIGGDGLSTDPLLLESFGSPGIFVLDSLSSVTVSESVEFLGGLGSGGEFADGIAPSGSSLTAELFRRPGLSLSAATGQPGDSFDVAFDGEPGGLHTLAFSVGLVANYSFPNIDGTALLDPENTDLFTFQILDGSGSGSFTVDVPNEPALTGAVAHFQSLQNQAVGGSFLSLPSSYLVGQ